jgi:hypothetical protein
VAVLFEREDRERSRGWEREGLGWDERGMVGLKYISH